MKDHATIECVRCGASFDGTPHEQVMLFNLHECAITRQMWQIEREHAMRRHPTGRMVQSTPSISKMVIVIAAILGALLVLNWVLATLPQQDWFGMMIAGSIMAGSLLIGISHLVKKAGD